MSCTQTILNIAQQAIPLLPILIPTGLMLFFALAAVALRNLIHSALCVTGSFMALGVLFIAVGAEFVGLVQLMVYVGAVSMLIIFAILLTPANTVSASNNPLPFLGIQNWRSWQEWRKLLNLTTLAGRLLDVAQPLWQAACGAAVALVVLAGLLAAIFTSPHVKALAASPGANAAAAQATLPVAAIGQNLLGPTFVPLLGIAILLTAALIGAALLAMDEKGDKKGWFSKG